jgi:hypothetical protein
VLGDKDLRVDGPFLVRYEVARRQETIHVGIDISGRVQTNCSRCLSPVTYPVDLHLESDYVPAPPEMEGAGPVAAHHLRVQRGLQGALPPVRRQPERGPVFVRQGGGPEVSGPRATQEQTLKRDRSQQCRYQRGDTRAPGETSAGPTIQ